MSTIDAKLVEVALEYCRTDSFERLARRCWPAALALSSFPWGACTMGE